MKKVFLSLLLISGLVVFNSSAQIQVGAFGTYNKILGDAGEDAPAGFGGGVDLKYFVTPKFAIGLNAGYIQHSDEQSISIGPISYTLKATQTIIPVTVNADYFFTEEGFRPYVGLGLGLYALGGSAEANGVKVDADSESKFGFAPHLGAQYFFNKTVGLDLNVKYNYILSKDSDIEGSEDLTTFGVNLGLVFQFGGK